jgi:epoxyqueuosine reductase
MNEKIKNFAIAQGFDLVGFSPVNVDPKSYKIYKNWLKKKFEAGMAYMSRKDAVEKRKSAAKILKNAKTVICLAVNYYHDQPPLPKGHGRIARYAFGRDYHKILLPKLKRIEKFIKENSPESSTLSYVDTGPILERTFAAQAGLGFIGKNRCLITKEFGSWVFLAEIITDLALSSREDFFEPQTPKVSLSLQPPFPGSFPGKPKSNLKKTSSREHPCSSCTRCIDACPTKALTPQGINSKKCLSYLTIEHKGKFSKQAKEAIKKTKRIFGCDICQEACPYSSPTHPKSCAKPTSHKEFLIPSIAGDSLDNKLLLGETQRRIKDTRILLQSTPKRVRAINRNAKQRIPWRLKNKIRNVSNERIDDDNFFFTAFAGSPITRIKRRGLERNLIEIG